MRGLVVHDQRRSGLERRVVGQRERGEAGHDDALGEGAEGHRRDAAAVRGRARELQAERERRVGPDLVLPAAEQQVDEGHAAGADLDHDLVVAGDRLGHVGHADTVGADELADLQGAHAPSMPV